MASNKTYRLAHGQKNSRDVPRRAFFSCLLTLGACTFETSGWRSRPRDASCRWFFARLMKLRSTLKRPGRTAPILRLPVAQCQLVDASAFVARRLNGCARAVFQPDHSSLVFGTSMLVYHTAYYLLDHSSTVVKPTFCGFICVH